ncbi:hypothetical protein [Dickeya oryzae]
MNVSPVRAALVEALFASLIFYRLAGVFDLHGLPQVGQRAGTGN